MIQIPPSERELLACNGQSLTAVIDFNDELIDESTRLREPKDFEGRQALAVLAVSRVAGVIRNKIRNKVDPEVPQPDLIVATPEASWLGQRVGMAIGIDFMRLFKGEDGSVQGAPSLSRQYEDRQNVVVVTSLLEGPEDLCEILELPEIKGRAMGAVVLIDQRALAEKAILGTPVHAVFARQPVAVG